MHIIFGIYLWEFVTSLDFDWLYVRGQKRWTLAAGVGSLSLRSCVYVLIVNRLELFFDPLPRIGCLDTRRPDLQRV